MSKKTRQQAIIEIVSSRGAPSQAALAQALKQLGFDVTQATLSRDIAELNLVKSKDGYLRPEEAGGPPGRSVQELQTLLEHFVIKIEASQNLVVVQTPAASARQVGLALDELELENVLGTVAGNDTVLVAVRTDEDARDIKNKLLAMIDRGSD